MAAEVELIVTMALLMQGMRPNPMAMGMAAMGMTVPIVMDPMGTGNMATVNGSMIHPPPFGSQIMGSSIDYVGNNGHFGNPNSAPGFGDHVIHAPQIHNEGLYMQPHKLPATFIMPFVGANASTLKTGEPWSVASHLQGAFNGTHR